MQLTKSKAGIKRSCKQKKKILNRLDKKEKTYVPRSYIKKEKSIMKFKNRKKKDNKRTTKNSKHNLA